MLASVFSFLAFGAAYVFALRDVSYQASGLTFDQLPQGKDEKNELLGLDPENDFGELELAPIE